MEISEMPGKTILVGMSYYTRDGVLIERKQAFGTVEAAGERGIRIRCDSGEILCLPPNLQSTKRAPAGEYRLRSTGQIVKDPDYLSTWNIVKEGANNADDRGI